MHARADDKRQVEMVDRSRTDRRNRKQAHTPDAIGTLYPSARSSLAYAHSVTFVREYGVICRDVKMHAMIAFLEDADVIENHLTATAIIMRKVIG